MGRRRLEEQEKKANLKITVKKKYIEEFKNKNINISQFVEEKMKDFLKK